MMNSKTAVWFCLAILSANLCPSPGAFAAETGTAFGRKRATTCTRSDLVVNLSSIRANKAINLTSIPWLTSIVSPVEFNIYRCEGNCSHVDVTPERMINYLLVESILQRKAPHREFRGPCCVPTELDPMFFSYMGKNGELECRAVPDMIVKECGCV